MSSVDYKYKSRLIAYIENGSQLELDLMSQFK